VHGARTDTCNSIWRINLNQPANTLSQKPLCQLRSWTEPRVSSGGLSVAKTVAYWYIVRTENQDQLLVAVAAAYLMAEDPSLKPRKAQELLAQKRCESNVGKWFLSNLLEYYFLLATRREDPGREIERSTALLTKAGSGPYELARRLGIEISDRIDSSFQEKANEVYHSISYDDAGVMGAVGSSAQAVRASLRTGTLHERIAHAMSFFVWLAPFPDRRIQLGLSGENGDLSLPPRAFVRAKEEIVLERSDTSDASLINTETAWELGLEVSDRQTSFWGQNKYPDPIPPFRRVRFGIKLSPGHIFAKYRPAEGQSEFGGPSTHAFWLFQLAQLFDYDLDETADLAEAYLGSIGAHTRHEIDVVLKIIQQKVYNFSQ